MKYYNIRKFQELLFSDQEQDSILEAIRKLSGLDDTNDLFEEVKGFRPLGSWSGWSW